MQRKSYVGGTQIWIPQIEQVYGWWYGMWANTNTAIYCILLEMKIRDRLTISISIF